MSTTLDTYNSPGWLDELSDEQLESLLVSRQGYVDILAKTRDRLIFELAAIQDDIANADRSLAVATEAKERRA